MQKIDGSPKSLKQLLLNTKYSIHYYQREYMWQQKQIEELIDDLTSEFLIYYNKGDDRLSVMNYGAYFMGSIVLAGRENAIIDGQQRFTSLTLLLMYLHNRLKAINEPYSVIDQMIYSESFGKKSFNIDVDDRSECMNAIFSEKQFDITDASESVKNLYGRYEDIVELFPEEISDDMLLHFCDWLAERVFFIEIVTNTEQDAHKVFVSMNDRGLSLTSTEMLKGYVLSEIKNDDSREKYNDVWKEKVLKLKNNDDKGDELFIKAWLRSQHAETIRESVVGAVNKDFDIIGGPFHKWVREEREKLNLNTSADFELFIDKFAKFAEIYLKIKEAEQIFDEKTKFVYYNAQLGFTLQSQLLLAPICYEDSWETIYEKINLVSRFVDLFIIARVTNYKSCDYSTIKNHVFGLTKSIRNTSVETLKCILKEHYDAMNYNAEEAIYNFGLNGFTKKYIKHILARLTGYIEEQCGVESNYLNYINHRTKNPYEIEHIICDHYEEFMDEFADKEEFIRWRNDIGGLLLLHKSINASLNDESYTYKLNSYCSNEGNIYTESLGGQAYKNNPRFNKFIKDNELSFEPYEKFGKDEIEKRNKLVAQLAKLVWNTSMFD